MGEWALLCWSCDERALAIVARREGRVVAGLCADCARYERLLRTFAAAVASPALATAVLFEQTAPHALLSYHRVFR